jgi:hypothetical protein
MPVPDVPQQGRDFRPSATQWQEHNRAAEAVRAWQQQAGFDPSEIRRSQTVVIAHNSTGSDLEQYDACYLYESLYGRNDNAAEFTQRPSWRVRDFNAPGYGIPAGFAVAQEPIPSGKDGRVAIAGVTLAKIHDDPSYGGYYVHPREDSSSVELVRDCWGSRLLVIDQDDTPYLGLIRLDDVQWIRPIELREPFDWPDVSSRKGTATFYPLTYTALDTGTPVANTAYYKDIVAVGPPYPMGWGRDESEGVQGCRGWATRIYGPASDQWQLLTLNEGVEHGKVQSSYSSNYGPSPFYSPQSAVTVKRYVNGVEHGSPFPVHMLIPAGLDPALFEDDIIAYAPSDRLYSHIGSVNSFVVATPHADDKRGMIKWWFGSVANIPAGWALCDGDNGTIDLSGRFILCIDQDGRLDEDAIGRTGGFRWHGETENNHSDHPTHAAGAGPGIIGAGETEVDLSHAAHDGPTNNDGDYDTDNRPPYYVLAAIQCVS